MRPSGSEVTVGYQRGFAMSAAAVQPLVAGSKMFVLVSPQWAALLWPPATKTFPSPMTPRPPQKMLDGDCDCTSVLVAGSQTRASEPQMSCPSDIRTLPFGISQTLTATIGIGIVPDHSPDCGVGDVFENVTATGAAVPPLKNKS